MMLYEERKWCLDNQVDFTPEIFINGRVFLREFDKTDLLFFHEDLIENHESDRVGINLAKEVIADI